IRDPLVTGVQTCALPILLDVVITNKSLVGKTIAHLAAMDFARGVFLKKLTRVGEPMPFSSATGVERGDVMTLVGARQDVERAAKIGRASCRGRVGRAVGK